MNEFSISNLPQGAIQYLYAMREMIWLDPPYQRMSDIWPRDKRQLLVDSVINGYDIPKLYFHELVPARQVGNTFQKYAIIDGKQRLETLWGFMDGNFALADDFEYLHDENVEISGLTYREIGDKYPMIKSRFDATSLIVVAVRTDDTELIDDMFSRLNEAVPLNAPEKRNAFGGPLPGKITELSSHRFFRDKLAFSNRRFKHRDLAAKFLLIEALDKITDTKKAYLDAFVRDWANPDNKKTNVDAECLKGSVVEQLDRMADVFVDQDFLLKSLGMTLLLYHFFRLAVKTAQATSVRREHFCSFETARQQNRRNAETDISTANYDLLEFDKYVQTPNDAYATRIRLKVLADFMREKCGMGLPKQHDYISSD
jgi:hypothetical protein